MKVQGALPEHVRKMVEQEVGGYCESRVPQRLHDRVRIEYRIRGNSVTLLERHSMKDREGVSVWSSNTVAQLRYEGGKWAIYWSDRNDKWHAYHFVEPAEDLTTAFMLIDDDQTGVFWG